MTLSAQIFDGDSKRVTLILARLLQLLPLNLSSIEEVEAELADQAQEGQKFLKTFIGGDMVEEYKMDQIEVNCKLRRY
jgi:hypothetical protein